MASAGLEVSIDSHMPAQFARGPGEGKLGALAMAIGLRLRGAEPREAATSRQK